MLDTSLFKEQLLSRKGLASFFAYTACFMVVGFVWNTSPGLWTLFALIGFIFFFSWAFFAIKWLFLKVKAWVKQLPSVGKNIVDNAKIMYSDDGNTEIDTFLTEMKSLDIADIHDTEEVERKLKWFEKNINIDLSEIEKKRLVKKSIKHLEEWTQKASEDYLITEWELMVWMWLYNIVSTLSEWLNKYVSKSEWVELAKYLRQVNKYYTIYKLSIKGEYPECEIDMALKNDERGLFEEDALLQKSKTVREMHWYSGFSSSIRIAKGFSYRIGTVRPITSTKTVQYIDDTGKFIITNSRVGFVWAKQNFLIPVNKIIQFEATNEGLFLMKENTTKMHHIVLSDYDIPLLILEKLYKELKEGTEEPEETKKTSKNRLATPIMIEEKKDDYMEEIAKLAKLKVDGLITEEEFTEKKKKILWI